ncbi:hypothetical protein HYH02_001402 [Chlamydomonas schloesseri]|uniref:Uncharacterized protein n=1 Tax=Chlamydomonas schloesseri TaxID=2026947 RepID=A0A835WU98_9CHLO|nr:hypothetical protein HYH02_001402 [Chlamydomonas schloesseri]|eukprot:KAG2454379.1 hypothetical protein HYH02_001402 [Chlamydomonas schloesseri]
MVVPELLNTDPQKGLVAVMEHVQKCVPAAAAATRVLARQADEAELVAEELQEVAAALQEHADAGAPAIARMNQRLGLALQALKQPTVASPMQSAAAPAIAKVPTARPVAAAAAAAAPSTPPPAGAGGTRGG